MFFPWWTISAIPVSSHLHVWKSLVYKTLRSQGHVKFWWDVFSWGVRGFNISPESASSIKTRPFQSTHSRGWDSNPCFLLGFAGLEESDSAPAEAQQPSHSSEGYSRCAGCTSVCFGPDQLWGLLPRDPWHSRTFCSCKAPAPAAEGLGFAPSRPHTQIEN